MIEIELFSDQQFLVAAPAWDILEKLYGSNLYESNLKKLVE
jgi:hypothetical protein